MRKAILVLALGAAVAQAIPYNLNCVEGVAQCPNKDCMTLRLLNETRKETGELQAMVVDGELKAELTGAAKLASDGKFEIRKTVDKEVMSCFVPTGAFKNSVKTVSLKMRSHNTECNYFLPKGAGMSGKLDFKVMLRSNSCVIAQG
ncbi:MAG: hypothetical protein VX737_06765 [Pseudomonadota bacterium]|nr:hypothetical protein [Pseudomonadota bacterium]